MDRSFDYAQKILLAVEFAETPKRMTEAPASYAVFKRLSIAEVLAAAGRSAGSSAHPPADEKFQSVLGRRMGYWEERIPAGKHAFVHYAIAADDVITAAFDKLKANSDGFALLGVFRVEPQSSAYPFSFPFGDTPDHWRPGEHFSLTAQSIFWFNFFPDQPYLFEKTFAAWATFQTQRLTARGENNQLVVWEGKRRQVVNGIVEIAQVNLNRFTSLAGFFESAKLAGELTYTDDVEYAWYGMLLSKL